jgi:Tol biopolymer transport system component
MSPQPTIAHYHIRDKLGEGGMGSVYRAKDTKLNRDVAIKLLPDTVRDDREWLARFTREAQVLASLNHPSIGAIYGVEDRALILELVEGPTLYDRIQQGRLEVDEALRIARPIAEALEYAHDKGIIHRDLKPSNIKLTNDGRVKVLDFGLAKALFARGAEADLGASSTATLDETEAGTILGTAAYMSPEQARGMPVDRRTDIWAFGVVLYEMLTGMRPFRGKTRSDVLAAVLKEEPDWSAVPFRAQRLLRSCLEKDPHRRLRDIGDAELLLEETPGIVARRSSRWPWAVAALFAVAAVLARWPGITARQQDRPVIRFSADLGPAAMVGPRITVAITPDGNRIAFPWRDAEGRQILATRRLNESTVTPLPGTESGQDPFFSTNGESLGFFTASNLKVVSVQGAAPMTLATTFTARGATWDTDGSVIAPLTNRGAMFRIPADGGAPQKVTQLEPLELTHRWPQLLPGGRAVLFTARTPSFNSYENAAIDAVTLKTGARKTLLRGGYFGRYLPTRGSRGHLIYLHEGVLFAVPFDPERLELEGTPARVVEDIASDPISGAGQFDASASGTLVYLAGPGMQAWPMAWLDAAGATEPILSKTAMYYSPRFSPDGRRLAFAMEAGNGSDLYVYEFAHQSITRLTFTQQGNIEPVWTPDGKYIAYRSTRPSGLWWIRADGGGEPQLLSNVSGDAQACSFSPDGKRLAYQVPNGATGLDISILPLDLSDPDHPKPGTPEPLLATNASERYAAFSPNGRWIAYQSDESGNPEVYVRRVSDPRGKWQVSVGSGTVPIWSRNGREIFYRSPANQIMVSEYEETDHSFVARNRRAWSPAHILDPGYVNLDLAPDGKRFAVFLDPRVSAQRNGNLHVTFLLNFFDELRRRAPAGGK